MKSDNLLIHPTMTESVFKDKRLPFRQHFREQDHRSHGQELLSSYQEGCEESKRRFKGSTISLTFHGDDNLLLKVKSLETKGSKLLNVQIKPLKVEQEVSTQVVVSIPKGNTDNFKVKITNYQQGIRTNRKRKDGGPGKIQLRDLMDSLDSMSYPDGRSVWFGEGDYPENESVWCECWIRSSREQAEEDWQNVITFATGHDFSVSKEYLVFEEQIVFLMKLNGSQIDEFLYATDRLSCVRRAPVAVPFFSGMKDDEEQKNWVDDLLPRVSGPKDGGHPSVSLLDEGVNYTHPLLAPFVDKECAGALGALPPFEAGNNKYPHATLMAGILGYGNLAQCLAGSSPVQIKHSVESMRIYPNTAQDSVMYGNVTKAGVEAIERNAHHQSNSIFCMPLTEDAALHNQNIPDCDGSPSSWSTVVDELAYGDTDGRKRLFILCVGNVKVETGYQYPSTNLISPAQSPSQSWNALTVGAYADKVLERSSNSQDFSVARFLQLSPTCRTTKVWKFKQSPIKPDVVFPGGNLVQQKGEAFGLSCEELSALTTGHNFKKGGLFDIISDTSEASALAARMAACLMARYPSFWPETIRGLIIHSARWAEPMISQFSDKKERFACFGYGIPDIERAEECIDNRVNLIVQGRIVPEKDERSLKANGKPGKKEKKRYIQYYELPWPEDILQSLGSVQAELRVTLSYFIEPNPGHVEYVKGHQYDSLPLEFDVNGSSESFQDFQKRINKADKQKENGMTSSGRLHWAVKDIRKGGSVHSDYIRTSAINLAHCHYLAVYPKNGWWSSLTEKRGKEVRYSVIVTISTEKQDVPLLSEVINKIKVMEPVPFR